MTTHLHLIESALMPGRATETRELQPVLHTTNICRFTAWMRRRRMTDTITHPGLDEGTNP